VATIKNVLDNVGLNLGSTIAQEHVHAAEICQRFGLGQVRFCNSGTEANLHALAGARAFTGKRKVVVFNGGYHGGVFSFSGGVPAPNNVDLDDWIVATYNDIESAAAAIKGEGVAAVLVEGMQGAGGAIVGTVDFLRGVEAAAKEVSSALDTGAPSWGSPSQRDSLTLAV
jgi:glutamate-1-semialdehyde 2,1-aminomutase